jgi:hypothetical protein
MLTNAWDTNIVPTPICARDCSYTLTMVAAPVRLQRRQRHQVRSFLAIQTLCFNPFDSVNSRPKLCSACKLTSNKQRGKTYQCQTMNWSRLLKQKHKINTVCYLLIEASPPLSNLVLSQPRNVVETAFQIRSCAMQSRLRIHQYPRNSNSVCFTTYGVFYWRILFHGISF